MKDLYWSDCGQVFYLDGWGYGLTDTLQTICAGREEDIKRFFETGQLNNELCPTRRQVLMQIKEYREEQGIGIRETNMVRAGNDGASGGQQKAIRPFTPRKRLALRTSHQKH